MATSVTVRCKKERKGATAIKELEKVWLSSAEVRAWLDCSDEFLSKLRDNAEIVFAQIGGKFYHEAASILKMFEKHKVTSKN